MTARSIRLPVVVLLLTIVLPCTAISTQAQSTTKPLLSEEIRSVLEQDGPAAAQRRFDEIFPDQQDQWEVDPNGLAALAAGYMQSGNMAAGQAIMTMVGTVTQHMVANAGANPGAASRVPSPRATQSRAATPSRASSGRGPDLGPARDDLERFVGEYGDDPNRRLFVTVSCEGHLVSGATWGDASNWWLRSESDTDFTYSDSFTSLKMSFEVGSDGQATALTHDLDYLPSRLERHPLRDDWKECVRPPWG
jgi:hypothetical protein